MGRSLDHSGSSRLRMCATLASASPRRLRDLLDRATVSRTLSPTLQGNGPNLQVLEHAGLTLSLRAAACTPARPSPEGSLTNLILAVFCGPGAPRVIARLSSSKKTKARSFRSGLRLPHREMDQLPMLHLS